MNIKLSIFEDDEAGMGLTLCPKLVFEHFRKILLLLSWTIWESRLYFGTFILLAFWHLHMSFIGSSNDNIFSDFICCIYI